MSVNDSEMLRRRQQEEQGDQGPFAGRFSEPAQSSEQLQTQARVTKTAQIQGHTKIEIRLPKPGDD